MKRALIAAAAFAALNAHATEDVIQSPKRMDGGFGGGVTVTGDRGAFDRERQSAQDMIDRWRREMIPRGSREIWSGNVDRDNGAGTITGYRVISPVLQPGVPLQAAGAVAAVTGIATANPVLAAVGATAGAIGTVANVGAAPGTFAGQVVDIPANRQIAPRLPGKRVSEP